MKCPACKEPLQVQRGRYGLFAGCSGFQATGCRHTVSLSSLLRGPDS
ncbi:MAG: topoisomerase DNA-binding C4 zinc finger domain-containing protein [Bacillota bacterium]